MPQPFNDAVMTNDGAALLAKATAGECTIEFVRLAVGSGSYSAAEKAIAAMQSRKALKSERNSYAFSDKTRVSEYALKLTALITNQNPITQEAIVTEGYYINEMGVYAKEKNADNATEILFSVVVTAGSTGDYMPPYSGLSPAQITQDYYVTVNNSAQAIVNTAGAALLAEDANKIEDDTTGKKYRLGIDNGKLYYQEMED